MSVSPHNIPPIFASHLASGSTFKGSGGMRPNSYAGIQSHSPRSHATHNSARRPSRQFHLNFAHPPTAVMRSVSADLRQISSTPSPWEAMGNLGDDMPPPEREPPRPPGILHLPSVPQMPTAFSFSVEPTRAAFNVEGGMSRHVLVNHSPDRFAVKVRCSNNYYFRVNPVFSFLDAGCVSELEVIRLQGGGRSRDRIQLIYTICRDSDVDASTLFGPTAKTRAIWITIQTA